MQQKSSNGFWIIIAVVVFALLLGTGLMFSSPAEDNSQAGQNQAQTAFNIIKG